MFTIHTGLTKREMLDERETSMHLNWKRRRRGRRSWWNTPLKLISSVCILRSSCVQFRTFLFSSHTSNLYNWDGYLRTNIFFKYLKKTKKNCWKYFSPLHWIAGDGWRLPETKHKRRKRRKCYWNNSKCETVNFCYVYSFAYLIYVYSYWRMLRHVFSDIAILTFAKSSSNPKQICLVSASKKKQVTKWGMTKFANDSKKYEKPKRKKNNSADFYEKTQLMTNSANSSDLSSPISITSLYIK